MNKFGNFLTLNESYFHLSIGARKDIYAFYGQISFHNPAQVVSRIFRGWKLSTVEDLYNEFAAVLQFPYYFGENWAAFDECFNDLEWIALDKNLYPAKGYILVISDIDKVLIQNPSEFEIFIKILMNTVKEWIGGRTYNPSFPTSPTPFHVVFHCEPDKEKTVLKRFADAGLENIDIFQLEHDAIL